jgi:uncharacterized protein (TIGR03435 family)
MRILVLLAATLSAFAQNVRPSFEVTSIKPSAPDTRSTFRVSPGGEFRALHWSLKELVMEIYALEDFQIRNDPKWMNTEQYDFDAKPATSDQRVDRELVREMIKNLFADRFGLKFHWETKELLRYELTVTKDGPKFKESTLTAEGPRSRGRGVFNGKKVPIAWLAAVITEDLHALVIDKTGLRKDYDILLKYTPDQAVDPNAPPGSEPADAGPSLFTALQQQLGLKLVPVKGQVKIMVIDAVEKPDAN